MRPLCVGILLPVFLATTWLMHAQSPTPAPLTAEKATNSAAPSFTSPNEFSIWAGYSPFSFKLEGVSKDRKLFLLNLRYAREVIVTKPVTLRYTAEAVPVALEMQPTQIYFPDDNLVINPAATVYGAGASPIGFQGNFGQKRVQPFANGSVGFLYFNRQVPIIGSSQFNYTVTIGFGAQFFQKSGHSFTLGWKYHHLSNANQAHLNPGIDSSIFYVGFSVPRLRLR
jgi:hypothetical protein